LIEAVRSLEERSAFGAILLFGVLFYWILRFALDGTGFSN
jgi:hypothetical protein